MTMQSHLVELEKQHEALETEIQQARQHLSIDDLTLVELKRRKLQVKDEITKLKHTELASIH